MLKKLQAAVLGLCLVGLVACGGGGGGSGSGSGSTNSATSGGSGGGVTNTQPTNILPLVIDAGPASISASNAAINLLFASVTICTPGSTTACQVIDHLQVDTGSVGLRILASVLNGTPSLKPIADPVSGNRVLECVQFADGYTWGSMVTADVTLGSRTLSNVPVNLIGDSSSGAVTTPSSCASGTNEGTVAVFGANGVLGVGNYLQDCGTYCSAGTAPSAYYYTCPSGTCSPVLMPLALQAVNPVGLLSSDNNGLVIKLPSVAAVGADSVSGSLYYGINTQTNNALSSTQLMTLDAAGNIQTTFGGSIISQSFIDSGSNANFFDSNLSACTHNTEFYCPTSGGSPSTVAESAQLQGQNTGVIKTVSFTVSNADSLFQSTITADPGLAGPATPSASGSIKNYFDWGLPLFFGRSVYVLLENASVGTVQGPAVGF